MAVEKHEGEDDWQEAGDGHRDQRIAVKRVDGSRVHDEAGDCGRDCAAE